MVTPTTVTFVLGCFPLFSRLSPAGHGDDRKGYVRDRCGGPREASSSFVLLYINLLMHLSHRTTFTNALFDSPFSI